MCGRLQVSDLHQSQIGYQQLNPFEALYVESSSVLALPLSHTRDLRENAEICFYSVLHLTQP